MRSYMIAGLFVISLISAGLPAVATDLTLRQRVTISGPKSDAHESTQYWTADRLVTDDPDMRVIIDLKGETMTMADKQRRTYFTQTFAEMRQQSEAARAEMEKRMAELPPQAREMMGKMGMGPKGAGMPVSVNPTGKSEKIAGYEAKEYALQAGSMSGSVWATEALEHPGGPKATEALGKAMGGMGPGSEISQAMAKVKGVPLRTTMGGAVGPHGFSTTTEVIEVIRKTPPADVLQVPAGFTKTEPPRFGPMPPPKGPPAR